MPSHNPLHPLHSPAHGPLHTCLKRPQIGLRAASPYLTWPAFYAAQDALMEVVYGPKGTQPLLCQLYAQVGVGKAGAHLACS